ncbi:hypothetical protein OIU85_025938 [Salix viminalis]|uniref:Uncharacterized protein n=1 Tax=Salix viminalis TaxID=40686 RepID=A0A9Q0TMF0_SALVM|nr:hypothetical protein OIU85_025938 [Salix viminalis]
MNREGLANLMTINYLRVSCGPDISGNAYSRWIKYPGAIRFRFRVTGFFSFASHACYHGYNLRCWPDQRLDYIYLKSLIEKLSRQQKKVSAVDMELAAARQAGFVSKKLIGRKTNRDAIRKAWMPTGTALKKHWKMKRAYFAIFNRKKCKLWRLFGQEIDNENRQSNDFIVLKLLKSIPFQVLWFSLFQLTGPFSTRVPMMMSALDHDDFV